MPISDHALRRVRIYGELVAAVSALCNRSEKPASQPIPLPFWARIAADGVPSSLQRAGMLTPYAIETLTDDVLSAGRGARLEMRVPARTSDARLAELKRRFRRLTARGVPMSVGRADDRGVAALDSQASNPATTHGTSASEGGIACAPRAS